MRPTSALAEPQPVAGPTQHARVELALLLALVLVGFALRVWQVSSVGLDHFDEGVYAFSALGLIDPSQPYRLYPEQVKFSPPAFLGLIGLAYLVSGGPSDVAATLVSVCLGTLTIAAIWWVGRSWFGPRAGIAAAALLALNEYHISLSRAALTDVAFSLFLLLAFAAIAAAIQRERIGLAVLAGLAVGLAWNTKYHGWFAPAIAGAALLPYAWYRGERDARVRAFLLLGVVAAVALASFLPWLLFVQAQPGGYAELAAHQREFVSRHWWTQLRWQVQMQLLLDGPLSKASVLVAMLCALLVGERWRRLSPRFALVLAALSAAVSLIGSAGAVVLLALLAVPTVLRRPRAFSGWLALSWLAVWFVVTPLYRPFARLVLPFSIAAYLLAGLWLARSTEEKPRVVGRSLWRPALAAAGVVLVLLVAASAPGPSNPWRPSRSVAEAASAMESVVEPGSRVVVIGEPELAFYLHLAGRPAFERTEKPAALESLRAPVYLVTGVYAQRVPEIRDWLKSRADRLVPLGTYPMSPSDVRLLDDFSPSEALAYRAAPDDTYDLRLYRLLPKLQVP